MPGTEGGRTHVLPWVGDERHDTGPRLARFAWLSIAPAVVTITLKTGAYLITGSVGLLSDAAESVVNLVAAIIALIALSVAAKPADENHHYGHGKAEYFSAGAEGMMIFIAAAVILVSAVLLRPSPGGPGERRPGAGHLPRRLRRERRGRCRPPPGRTGAPVGDAHRGRPAPAHRCVDLGGRPRRGAARRAHGWQRLDPLVAMAVGINILVTGGRLVSQSVVSLLDASLSQEDQERIAAALARVQDGNVDVIDVRTRASGRYRFLSLVLRVPGSWTVQQADVVTTGIVRAVHAELPDVEIQVSLRPR